MNKRHHHHHRPNVNVSHCQKGTFYAGIKIANSLPPRVTLLKNDKAKLRAALRNTYMQRARTHTHTHISFTL
jgi:hypothetical protein